MVNLSCPSHTAIPRAQPTWGAGFPESLIQRHRDHSGISSRTRSMGASWLFLILRSAVSRFASLVQVDCERFLPFPSTPIFTIFAVLSTKNLARSRQVENNWMVSRTSREKRMSRDSNQPLPARVSTLLLMTMMIPKTKRPRKQMDILRSIASKAFFFLQLLAHWLSERHSSCFSVSKLILNLHISQGKQSTGGVSLSGTLWCLPIHSLRHLKCTCAIEPAQLHGVMVFSSAQPAASRQMRHSSSQVVRGGGLGGPREMNDCTSCSSGWFIIMQQNGQV